jgi:hypothetical protein
MFANNLGKETFKIRIEKRDNEGAKKYVREKVWDLVKNPEQYLDDLSICQKIGKKDYDGSQCQGKIF